MLAVGPHLMNACRPRFAHDSHKDVKTTTWPVASHVKDSACGTVLRTACMSASTQPSNPPQFQQQGKAITFSQQPRSNLRSRCMLILEACCHRANVKKAKMDGQPNTTRTTQCDYKLRIKTR
eukprot:3296014-Amphidinium_carterae.1